MTDLQRVPVNAPSEIQTGQQQVPIAAMFQAVIEKGVTAENAAAIEKLCDLHLKLEAIAARKSYARAMAAMQAELPLVIKTTHVAFKQTSFSYAKYEDIMRAIKPLLEKYGFSITSAQKIEGPLLISIVTISHVEGHSETTEFAVRHSVGIGQDLAVIDTMDSTRSRRHALKRALNLIEIGEEDDDARNVGQVITAKQAADLRERLKNTGHEEARFLKFAGADTFETIRSAKLPELYGVLYVAERAAKSKQSSPISADHGDEGGAQQRRPLLSHADLIAALESIASAHNVPESILNQWLAAKLPAKAQDKISPAARQVIVTEFENEATQLKGTGNA